MLRSSFRKAVDAAFEIAAVQVDDVIEKVLFKPGSEGLHVFLEGCRSEAQRSEVSEEILSLDSLTTVFDEKKWPHDSCFAAGGVGYCRTGGRRVPFRHFRVGGCHPGANSNERIQVALYKLFDRRRRENRCSAIT